MVEVMKPPPDKPMIDGVAIRFNEKEIYACSAPFRHHHVIEYLTKVRGMSAEDVAKGEQGFVTKHNKYVTRKEAYEIARIAGQLKKRKTGKIRELFSEDLW